MTPTTTDYHVITSLGVTVYTSPDRVLARREADRLNDVGCLVEVREVQHFTISRRVYRPRQVQREAA